jgi:hypothetical protein
VHPVFQRFAHELAFCQYGSGPVICPGMLDGSVAHDTAQGVLPRGLFVRPADASPAAIEVVVLGQNPGRCNAFERALARHLFRTDPPASAVETLNGVLLEAMSEIRYWKKIDQLLNALWSGGTRKPLLSLELAYCQTAEHCAGPSKAAYQFCSARYLRRHLAALQDGVNGNRSRVARPSER